MMYLYMNRKLLTKNVCPFSKTVVHSFYFYWAMWSLKNLILCVQVEMTNTLTMVDIG